MTEFFTNAPIWVWPLLGVLVVIGLRARHAREVPVALIYGLPALGIMTLRTTAGLQAGVAIWVVFLIAYAAGIWGGYLMQTRWTVARVGKKVQLSGENVTLAVMMVLFWANFAGGVVQAVEPALYVNLLFQGTFAGLIAFCGGSFAGRALRVWRTGV
ncbi:MAG: hypothetical protein ABJJ53_07095 [Sulfitobacter sp.]